MIQMNAICDVPFPRETILMCQQRPNQICRKKKPGRLRTLSDNPTILEMDAPQLFEIYDAFEIQDFTYSRETGTGHFLARLSLKETWHELGIAVQIVDLATEKVLAAVEEHRAKDCSCLVEEETFSLPAANLGGEIRLGLIAYGEWGDQDRKEHELAVFKEADSQEGDFEYRHGFPKKEKKTVVLGKIENMDPDMEIPEGEGEEGHIVIALIRRPDKFDDIDYLCGYGRDSHHNNRPILCVPGKGDMIFSSDETPKEDAEHKNYGICKLYRKNGGVSVIAGTPDYCCDNKIEITPVGHGYHYSFVSWDKTYMDAGSWKRTEFDYHLEMDVHTVSGPKDDPVWHKHHLVISKLEGIASFTDEVRPLQIMYGCVAPWTMIRMADGSEKEIRQIQIGDMVLSRNGRKRRVCNVWRGAEKGNLLAFTAGEDEVRKLTLTEDHPVLVRESDGNEKWKPAKACRKGDLVLVREKDEEVFRPIREIAEERFDGEVWNLDVDSEGKSENGAMFTEGILTGDYGTQNARDADMSANVCDECRRK